MKVSKLFHWLYASVMFIPLIIAPIFAIYVRNENSTFAETIEVEQNEVINFNQLCLNGNFKDNSNWSTYQLQNLYQIENNNFYIPDLTAINSSSQLYKLNVSGFNTGDKFIFKYKINRPAQYYLYVSYGSGNLAKTYTNLTNGFNYHLETLNAPMSEFSIYFGRTELSGSITFSNCQLFNLTQMFGAGNEPSIEQFKSYFPNDYYEYTLSRKELLKNIDTITYSNTDVGSQFIYTLYNATDKYFNFNQFLGIGNLLDWFQLNVFNGNAPLGFYIFWNLLIYWLLVSIAWLIFDIAMFVPKLAHRWLDKASLE